ncbi:MAG: TatD family hydrolase [Endozoicomonadaceae bacterium]|nr:TatD family hydrolase [Endozoicomonadaceae bacterium]
MYTDSHCHLNALNLEAYQGDLLSAIQAAKDRQVAYFLSICTSTEDFQAILKITQMDPNIWGTIGIHPLDIDKGTLTTDELIQHAETKKIVGFGETGLDGHYSQETLPQQIQSFVSHLEASHQSGLPVIIHTRSARQQTIDVLADYKNKAISGVIHCFTEDLDMAKIMLDLGFYISISGIVTFKNANILREVAQYVPKDRLLIETDSPYLAPIPYRGKPNEPQFVVEVGEYVAKLRDMSAIELATCTTNNFFKLFKKAERLLE